MGTVWKNEFKDSKGVESIIELLTTESKLILIYIAIVCIALILALIIMICRGCLIFEDEKQTSRPSASPRISNDASGNRIELVNVFKNPSHSSVKLPVKASLKIERTVSM